MKIQVERFQSIGAASIEAEGLTVIVGPSDRGKSALLRAIESALFNRPGDQFVKRGEKAAAVTMTFPHHAVTWEKGKGVNRFKIDGVEYGRVGVKAPSVLPEIGFKDVLIGARQQDDGSVEGGEWLRPQVAHQFDGPFLLTQSGAFLNEVLVGLSRLAVLQRASRFCSGDLRDTKQQLKTRRDDFAQAEAEAETLQPIVALHTRVEALVDRWAAHQEARGRVERLQLLLAERARLQAALAETLPAKAVKERDLQQLHKDTTKVAALRALVGQRQLVTTALATPFPKLRKIKASTASMVKKYLALRPLVIEQRQHRNWVAISTAEVERFGREAAKGMEDLRGIKAQLKVCPVCEKPW